MIEPRDAREAALLDLAHELGATVHYSDLPGTLRGVWDPNGPRILLRRRLASAQRVSTLAHEIVHARRGDRGCQTASTEQHVDELAARMLITEAAYRRAEILYGPATWAIAVELDVTPALVEAWKRAREREWHRTRCPGAPGRGTGSSGPVPRDGASAS